MMKTEVVPTTIPKLDEQLNGGLPQAAMVLFSAEPAIDVDVFGMQTFFSTIKSGASGVFVIADNTLESVTASFREYGWDLAPYRNRIVFIDCYSSLVGQPSNADLIVSNPNSIDEIVEKYEMALRRIGGSGSSILLFSLSPIIERCGEETVYGSLNQFTDLCSRYGSFGIFTLTEWGYKKGILAGLEKAVDAVVFLRLVETRVVFGQVYSLVKAKWAEPKKKKIMFKITKPGGIRAFIPKILITGPFSSGKSTFVQSISRRAISVDRKMTVPLNAEKAKTTIALDYGHIERKGIAADIFGTPGQERFDSILPQLSGSAMGVLLIVDSTKPETFGRAAEMLSLTKKEGLPFVVVANMQDQPGALGAEKIRKMMRLNKEVPIIPCAASKGTGVEEAFGRLVDLVMPAE